jgi:4-hydroxy-tetrahydrodipicolinate synthase
MTANKIGDGFYPALGTPLKSNGSLEKESYTKGIELMLESGAAGVLCMGSMGNMASIRNSEYPVIAKQCCKAVNGKVPVMVGVMDCSVSRVLDRIDALGDIEIDGVVATAPFYYKLSPGNIISFFKMLAKESKYPVYMYDLPPVTQAPVSMGIMEGLKGEANIKGIKTANLAMILEMQRSNFAKDDFSILYSGLDLFDVAIKYGIKKNLDGMFTCTPYNSKMMYANIDNGDDRIISESLKNILTLRNIFIKENVFSAYAYAMELLGCPGNYQPDYEVPVSENLKEEILSCMKAIKEI